MQVTREIETKLSVPEGFEVPPLGEVKGVHALATRSLLLRATYYDTDDLRLARSRTTLRHRTGEGRPCWTLKLEADRGRDELTVPGPGTSVPAVLQDLLTARLRGAPLHKVVQLRTRRTSSLLLDVEGEELVEVVDDLVEVSDGRGWRELEVELRPGGEKVGLRVLEPLRAAGAEVGDQTPKAVRALGPAAAAAPDLPEPGTVCRKDPAGALVRWSLRDGLQRLVEHDAGVRRGLDDAVHQVRVTCRRLRSDLRSLGPLLDDPRLEHLRAELAWLADSFGAARDLEVLRLRLRQAADEPPRLEAASIDALLEGKEQLAVGRAIEALRSTRYLLLLQLLHDVATELVLTELAEQRCDEVLPPMVERQWQRLEKQARRLRIDDEDARWHRARILAKRARYAAESAEVALGKDVRRTAKAAKKVQTILGEHQDAAVAERTVLDLAEDHPQLAVLCGRLAERERRHLLEIRRDFLAHR